MEALRDEALVRILSHGTSLGALLAAAGVSRCWAAAAFSKPLRDSRQELARHLALPRAAAEESFRSVAAGADEAGIDWLAFCARQAQLQSLFAGNYGGSLRPDNLAADAHALEFDWGEEHYAALRLEALSVELDRPAHASRVVYLSSASSGSRSGIAAGGIAVSTADSGAASEEEDDDVCFRATYQWLALDRRRQPEKAIWLKLAPHCWSRPTGPALLTWSGEAPPERWEGGDLLCGVRGPFDFRPVVDPDFLDVSPLVLLLLPTMPRQQQRLGFWALAWAPRLYAPSAWMLPKQVQQQAAAAKQLDLLAEFRCEQTVAALALGRQVERPLAYAVLDRLAAALSLRDGMAVAEDEAATGGGGRRRRRGARDKAKGLAAAASERCDGRNRKGLNYYVPRRQPPPPRRAAREEEPVACRLPPRDSVLLHESAAQGLQVFLEQHRASLREAEQLCVTAVPAQPLFDASGLIADATRLEMSGSISQASVVDLARKWCCTSGKWLLFAPEWRVDELFAAAALKLRSSELPGCTRIVVSPPGAYGTDAGRYMMSAHCEDFTNQKLVMALGRALRATARQGLRAPAGDWGELQDDPFAAPKKKVALTFKPDVFSYLNIHRRNPYGIRPSLYSIEL